MNLEQRLQHAARDLREVRIDPAPLDVGGAVDLGVRRPSSQRRIPALVAPVLFALGGLVMVAGGLRTEPAGIEPSTPTPTPTTIADVDPAERADDRAVTVTTTPGQELQIIAELVARAEPLRPAPADAAPFVSPGPTGPV